MFQYFCRRVLGVLIFALQTAFTSAAAAYSFVDLGASFQWDSGAYGINNAGDVTGFARFAGGDTQHAAMWQRGTAIDLQLAANPFDREVGYGVSINERGQTIGWRNSTQQAAIWDGRSQQILPAPGIESWGAGINDSGVAVGYTRFGVYPVSAMLWKGTESFVLASLGGDNTRAYKVNNNNRIVGFSEEAGVTNGSRAVWWSADTPQKISILGERNTIAFGVNDNDHVVGARSLAGGLNVPVVWRDGVMSDLPMLGVGTFNIAMDINLYGQIVGFSTHAETAEQHAALWVNDSVVDLNVFLSKPMLDAGWYLYEATSINDHGWIAGNARNRNSGVRHAFLLSTPVPEPSGSALLIAGIVAVVVIRWRPSWINSNLSIFDRNRCAD